MVQYSQGSDRLENHTEILTLSTCQRRNSEFEKRFCFDLTFKEKVGIIFTFQALSEDDRQTWLNIMGAIELVSVFFFLFYYYGGRFINFKFETFISV